MLGGSEDPDAAGAVLDDGKDVDLRAVEQVGGEEVQRQDPLRLGPKELRPARAIPARSPVDPGAVEDLPDRGWRHRDAEPASSPWIRRYPCDWFSRASRSTTARTLRCVAGRPARPRRDNRAHRRRTISRCQREIVPGVTISRIAARRSAGTVPASSASHARSGHANRQ